MKTGTGKLKMRTANNRPQKMPQVTTWQGTTDFFRPSIAYMREVMPGDHVIHDMNCVIQGKPMAMPAEVHLKHSLRAFYVPQRVISKDWMNFITETPFRWKEQSSDTETLMIWENDQWMTNELLVCMFMGNYYGLTTGWYSSVLETYDGRVKYDITCLIQDSLTNYKAIVGRNLTNKGRKFLQILNGLGIEINWFVNIYENEGAVDSLAEEASFWDRIDNVLEFFTDRNGESSSTPDNHDYIVTKPLLAYLKIMIDFYWPSQYENELEEWFKDLKDYQAITDPKIFDRVMSLFEVVAYEIDYFTGAWKFPTGPNGEETTPNIGGITDKSFLNPNVNSAYLEPTGSITNGSPAAIDAGNGYITKYLLNALDAVQNYVTRNRIAGYRPVDRFLAQFGVHLDYKLTNRCNYINGSSVELNITKVIAQAETAGAEAGQTGATDQQLLGGKGAVLNGQNKLHIDWKCEEHGFIIVIQTIIPRIGYYQGLKPHCTRLKVLDHYNGSFDNLGTEAIPRRYLFHNYESSEYDVRETGEIQNKIAALRSQVWGYSGTYMSMKVEQDNLSGDYRVNTLNEGIGSMHSLRVINKNGSDIPDSVNLDFMLGDQAQYDRLFAYTGNDVDHIYYDIINYNNGTRPMKSTSEALDITDGQGNYTSFDTGGSYMN